ncbi:MAG: lysophospholipid acyltransferase family protein [Ginsengibacter sp.]
MKFVSKGLKFIFSIYGFIIFLVVMFILLPFFIIAFSMKPLKGGNLVIQLSRIWARVFFFFTLIKSEKIYEEKPDETKEYIFVTNHISYIDIPMMMVVTEGKNVRILGKAEMTKIPVFGSIYKRGTVSVNRDNADERAQSVKKLIKFINKKISILICPEGTFNKTNEPLKFFYDGTFRIAIETQKPIKPILFLDTYNRLNHNSLFSLTPGKSRAVFLPETSTIGLKIEDLSFLKETIFKQMENGLLKYKADWIGKSVE